jgi:DNA-nicking Smr family endonuclease
MDFGKVLRDWEEGGSGRNRDRKRRRDLENWIDAYPPEETQHYQREESPVESAANRRRRLRQLSPQRVLDLHGTKAAEAAEQVSRFLENAARDGVEKVLIIHGKGKHSGVEGGVLKNVVYDTLRSNSRAGEIGVPDREHGGSGAVWVVVRYRSR